MNRRKLPINEIGKVVKESPLEKALRKECNIVEFCLTSKEEVVTTVVKQFQILESGRNHLNSLHAARINIKT